MDIYPVFRALGAILPRVPARWGHKMADWLADLTYPLNPVAPRGLRSNIGHVMGLPPDHEQVDQAARRAYRVLLENYFDLFHLPSVSAEQLRASIQLDGWEVVEAAHRLGRGVILCSAHIGHVEAALHIGALNGLPVLAPAEHVRPERLYNYLTRLRTHHGLRFIQADGPMLELFRSLKRGTVVGIVLDRDTTGSGVERVLCGEPAHLPDGYARLVAKTRAPLVPGFCYRLPDGRVRAELGPMFVPEAGRDAREQVYQAALDFGTQALERAITAHPDQWVLTTPIWTADCRS